MTPRRLCLAIVLLAGLDAASVRAATIQITIDKLIYAPAEATAKVGDTIEWINKDVLAHTATATNGDWNVMIGPSKTASLVLKKVGTIDYFCKFHPNMKARITIAP
jgi:plastocyanin